MGQIRNQYKELILKEEKAKQEVSFDSQKREGESNTKWRTSLEEVQKIIGYTFRDKGLLEEAYTDTSHKKDLSIDYERLEYIGDSVLNFVITSEQYCMYPNLSPGTLTRIRSANVSTEKLARAAMKHGLFKYLRHQRPILDGQIQEFVDVLPNYPVNSIGLIDAPKVLADIVESTIGAVFIDSHSSLQVTSKVIKKLLQPMITPSNMETHPMTKLHEICQKIGVEVNLADNLWKEDGEIEIYITNIEIVGRGQYKLKKIIANNRAAHDAYNKILTKLGLFEMADDKIDILLVDIILEAEKREIEMDFELRMAREKLEKEQKDRKEKARLKMERERKAKKEAIRQREAIEAALRSRRIDAMEAQLKADQHMEETLLAGRGIVFNRVLEAVPFLGVGDKIKLPPTCFTELSDQGSFEKGPLHFSLSVIHHENFSNEEGTEIQHHGTTHAGVLEFTAEEGSVGLPPHIWSNLFATSSPETTLIEVRYVWLPKGTYTKLQPLELGFSDIPNHKAVLETSLRQHATLSQNDVLTVNHGILTYHLRVLELKPSSSISVLETDIEVDILGPDSAPKKINQHVLNPLMFGKSESGVVDEGNYMYYKFSIDTDVWALISSESTEIEVKIDMEAQDGDTDLYISKHPLLFPTRHQHGWSSHDVGLKILVLSSKDTSLAEGTYSIGVYGFKGKTKYQLSVTVQDCSNRKVGQQAATSSSSFVEADTVECSNCRHYIPSRTIKLHEAYCSRHNVICQHAGCGVVLRIDEAKNHVHCEKCGLAFHGGEIKKHVKVFHEPLQCPCGVVLEKEQMVQHQSSDCPLRLVTCKFCGDMVQAGNSAVDVRDRLRGLSEHESVCGSRTAPCDSCGRAVMLKDMDIHQVAVHQRS